MCFEAEWITGSYQLIVPELPAQESVKTQHDQYHVELQPSECVNTPQQSARPLVVREGHNKCVRMAVLPHWLIRTCKVFRFRRKLQREAFSFRAACVLYSWGRFMKMSLLLIPETGSHPTDTANSIAGRCMKVPKQMGECRYLIFQWVIHGLFPFPLTFCLLCRSWTVCLRLAPPALHRWSCAYFSSAVLPSLWCCIRIADGEREGCLNAVWCFPKLCTLKPSRHESSPVTAWCLLSAAHAVFQQENPPALIRPWSKEPKVHT